jgi:hypothetical protein
LAEILADPKTDPSVLSYFALHQTMPREPMSALLTNPSLDDDALVAIGSRGSSTAIDLLLLNQERLVKTPAAVDALVGNGTLGPDQRRRLLDFIEHLGRKEAAPAPPTEPAGSLPPELLGPVSEEELRSLLGEMSDLNYIDLEVGEFLSEDSLIEVGDDLAALGASFESVYKQLLRMNPPQRLRAAMRGGREARQILIRDTNRIVASAVLRNPRLTEEEVLMIAGAKSVSEDVLRQVGTNRAWMGSYHVASNLIRNPKTPLGISMNHLARLTTKDLLGVVRDRNVSEMIRRFARKHVDQREAKSKPKIKH